MTKNEAMNKLCWIIIEAASNGYVPSNDLDFANECLDKLQGQPNSRLHSGQAGTVCRCNPVHGIHASWCPADRIIPPAGKA